MTIIYVNNAYALGFLKCVCCVIGTHLIVCIWTMYSVGAYGGQKRHQITQNCNSRGLEPTMWMLESEPGPLYQKQLLIATESSLCTTVLSLMDIWEQRLFLVVLAQAVQPIRGVCQASRGIYLGQYTSLSVAGESLFQKI